MIDDDRDTVERMLQEHLNTESDEPSLARSMERMHKARKRRMQDPAPLDQWNAGDITYNEYKERTRRK